MNRMAIQLYLNWRRVGEIEGGSYPFTQRLLPVDGLQPLRRPPVSAAARSMPIRRTHSPELFSTAPTRVSAASICTWNCQYGVPQYNADRGVVGKCDMCYSRLTDGREPACASNACPERRDSDRDR